ncbi:MAG: methyltransferase domain-containing protein [candidate division Zixibacteria bacterium]|nr:methyltransferase domain-containing protein [candidate division Zixibacteria bacterium]
MGKTIKKVSSYAAYSRFADVYDKMGADKHSIAMVDYTMLLLSVFEKDVSTCLDLCCGTGTALKLFDQRGIQMSGLDGSQEMLDRADEKLLGREIPLYCQRLPHVAISELQPRQRNNKVQTARFDLITSFYDALNYLLTEKELLKTFRAVYRHLQADGYFIFDMNTPHALATIWNNTNWSGVKDDIAWFWQNRFDAVTGIATCNTTFFYRQAGSWERFEELHTECAYPNSRIKQLLAVAGFHVRGIYNCFTLERPNNKSTRVCFVARRIR